jgi:predicted transcriptional regulator
LPPEVTDLGAAVEFFQHEAARAYQVLDAEGKLLGVCSAAEVNDAVCAFRPLETPLAEVLRRPPPTVRESQPLADALLLFVRTTARHLVVVADADEARPVGRLTPFDALAHYKDRLAAPAAKHSPSSTPANADHERNES